MNKREPLHRGKGIAITDIRGEKFIDLRSNSNILGFSNKAVTRIAKNAISSSWNLTGDTIYHRRVGKLYSELFGDEYEVYHSLSLATLFRLFFAFLKEKSMGYEVSNDPMARWLEESIVVPRRMGESDFKIIDMTERLLFDTNSQSNEVEADGSKLLLNYFWYPELEIESHGASIIILPEIYNGNFQFVTLLIKRGAKIRSYFEPLRNMPSLYLETALKQYYEIKRVVSQEGKPMRLESDLLTQHGRIFRIDQSKAVEAGKKFEDKNILINSQPPFYNYIPLTIEESRKKYLSRIII